MELITEAEYARRRGVSKEAVRKARRDGRIPTVRGKINPKAADRAWASRTDPSKPKGPARGRKRSPSASATYASLHAKREGWNEKQAELDYRERIGNLLDKREVEKVVFEDNRRVRDRVRLIEARMGAVLSPEVRAMLQKEIRDACDELSGASRNGRG